MKVRKFVEIEVSIDDYVAEERDQCRGAAQAIGRIAPYMEQNHSWKEGAIWAAAEIANVIERRNQLGSQEPAERAHQAGTETHKPPE